VTQGSDGLLHPVREGGGGGRREKEEEVGGGLTGQRKLLKQTFPLQRQPRQPRRRTLGLFFPGRHDLKPGRERAGRRGAGTPGSFFWSILYFILYFLLEVRIDSLSLLAPRSSFPSLLLPADRDGEGAGAAGGGAHREPGRRGEAPVRQAAVRRHRGEHRGDRLIREYRERWEQRRLLVLLVLLLPPPTVQSTQVRGEREENHHQGQPRP